MDQTVRRRDARRGALRRVSGHPLSAGLGRPTGYDGVFKEGMVMCVEALAAPAQGREAVKLEEQVLITTDGFEQLSSYPLEESWL